MKRLRLADEPLYVISYCDGIGCVFVALEQLHIDFLGIAVEREPACRACTQRHFPHLAFEEDVMNFDIEQAVTLASQAGSKALLLAGGPPCQPFSSAGKQRSFKDPRSAPLTKFLHDIGLAKQACAKSGLKFYFLLEEVASMPAEDIAWVSDLAGTPTLIHAADWGWVHRARQWWRIDVP